MDQRFHQNIYEGMLQWWRIKYIGWVRDDATNTTYASLFIGVIDASTRDGSDEIWSRVTVFFLTVWFQRERCEALQSIAVVGHVFSSMVKSVAENGMETEIWGLVMVVRVLVAMRICLGDLWLGAATSVSGGDNTREVRSLNFQDENSRFGLKWLCLAMVLLKTLFSERGLSPGWKPVIYDQGDDDACALLSSLRRRFLRKWIYGAILVMFGLLLQGIYHYIGAFFCNFSFFFCCMHPLCH
jgi:hypothetical protein